MTQDMLDIQRLTSGRQIVDAILAYAIERQGSDIHIEPVDDAVRLRLRCDGVLVPMGRLPLERLDTLTARIKIMASLDIANKILPQDGRFTWRSRDMRVSTMPTIRGEKTVIRLLRSSVQPLGLGDLGMADAAREMLRRLLHARRGLLLVSGPTGSGKSTTLYAALQELDDPAVSIATLEDPVEYGLSGISQSQIQPKQGLLFHTGLRALLRQDPDILVIGEIRDRETAQIAVRAALTGHMVLSTIHTATASDVPMRLIDMGVVPYLVADAVIGLTSQRLARRRCRCRNTENTGVACPDCQQRGYAGRFCLAEIVPVGPAVRQCIRQQGDAAAVQAAAKVDGAILFAEAIATALGQGLTDEAEIRRVYSE